jgi:PAS domain S-box-containing protein
LSSWIKKNADIVKSYMNKGILDGQEHTFEFALTRNDGETIPVSINAIPVKNLSGEVISFLGIIKDLSKQIKFEKTENYFTNLISTINTSIVAIDENMIITAWNRGAEKLYGYKYEEVIGKHVSILSADEKDPKIMMTSTRQAVQEGAVKNLITQRRRKDGTIVNIELSLERISDRDGRFLGVVGLARNISDIQEHLNQATRKNEEMEHLISTVSHDLRAPLYSIENYLHLLYEAVTEKMQEEEVYEFFNGIKNNLSNMESLIRDITDFSRAGLQSEEKVVDLNELVEDIVNNLLWQVGRKNLIFEAETLPSVRINPRKAHQIFENLIVNAYKFKKDDEPARIKISLEKDEKFVTFRVKDEGIGISEEWQDKIFELFYRTKEKNVSGTGAGLAITRKAISSYGGEIRVQSSPACGTTFCFTLPTAMAIT